MPRSLIVLSQVGALLKGLLPLTIALVCWQLFLRGSAALPVPSDWWSATLQLAVSGALLPAFLSTMVVLVVSLLLASAVAFVVGLFIGISPKLQEWLGPLLEYCRAIPPPVIIPVLVLALGYTSTMKIIVVGFAAFWPVLLNTIAGISQIKPLTFEIADSFRLSYFERIMKIVVPSAIPSLLLGLRVALPHTIILTLVAEIFTDAAGLGGLMIAAERNYNAPAVFGLLVIIGLLGFFLSTLFGAFERLVLRKWPRKA